MIAPILSVAGAEDLTTSSRQLATRLGIAQSAIRQLEESEKHHTISLETLERVAHAMRCQLVYAIIPQEPFSSLEEVIDNQSLQAAKILVSKVDHTMTLNTGATTKLLVSMKSQLGFITDWFKFTPFRTGMEGMLVS